MDADAVIYVSPVLASIQGISIIALLWNFYCYFCLPELSPGLKLILVLGISDFIMHITLFALSWPMSTFANEILSNVFNITLRFSIGWTANIAILVYVSIITDITSNIKIYLRYTLVILMLASIIPVIIYFFVPNLNELLFAVSMLLPLVISIFLTMFCYLRSIVILKRVYPIRSFDINSKIKNMYLYAVVQLITIVPSLVYCFLNVSFGITSYEANTVTAIFLGLSGFANAIVYFFQRRRKSSKTQEFLVDC